MARSKDQKLITAIRETVKDKRSGLYVPRHLGDVRTNWPVCQTCRRDVEAVELKNRNTKGVELWARCHGKEDWFKIDFPYAIPDGSGEDVVNDHVRIAMNAAKFFEPSIAY